MLTPFCVAVQFLTRIPVPSFGFESAALRRAPLYFPLVGSIVGALLWAAHALLTPLFPVEVVRTCLLGLGVAVTGALHLDALCDTTDAMFAGRDRRHILDVMRDPHVGAIGVSAVALALLLKHSALIALEADRVGPTLVAGAMASRSMMLGSLLLPPARSDGFGAASAQRLSAAPLLVCALGGVIAPLALLGNAALPALLLAAVAGGSLLRYAFRRLRGMTGDVCGAAGELAETAFWIGATCTTGASS